MSNFDIIKDIEGKEYLMFNSSELYDDSQIGNKLDDYEILRKLGHGTFGKVFKVLSKLNSKVYAMKQLNIKKIKEDNEKAYQLAINEITFLETLDNPHIIKYYKNFIEGDYLYIIIEYVANGDLKGFIEAHKIINKHIPEEDIWNIILQCMGALKYVHSTGVIHRDIKPANLLMDNNKIVKIGDFGVSALKINDENKKYLNGKDFKNKEDIQYGKTFVGSGSYMAKEVFIGDEYDHKVDVYSMGVSFFEMCYFHSPVRLSEIIDNNGNIKNTFERIVHPNDKNVHYSKELLNIIELMLEEDKNKRKTSKEILEMVQKEFSKKYVKNSSIDSIVRCLYSCIPLTKRFLNIPLFQICNKPITIAYIDCLKSVSKPSILSWINSIRYFRQTLCSENPKLEGTKEIEPRFVFAFFLKELHKELNNSKISSNKNKHLIISGEKESKTSKVEVMLKYVSELYTKFNSIISNYFLGLNKITNFCNKCGIRTFSFKSFLFVTFNLEHILKKNKIYELNLQEQFIKQKYNNTEKWFFCSKCLQKTKHSIYKEYYSLPNLLIISIQRGITYEYKTPITIALTLDLTQLVELQYSKKKFQLVGLLGRKVKNGNEIFFSIIAKGKEWYYCEEINIKKISVTSNANLYGDILMLFYM